MGTAQPVTAQDLTQSGDVPPSQAGELPGHPLPQKPIPYVKPGHESKSDSYTTTATVTNAEGIAQTVQLSGADAMAADDKDPLAGSYTLANKNTLLRTSGPNGQLRSYNYTGGDPAVRTNSAFNLGFSDDNVEIAAGDLNRDGTDEQIIADLEGNGHVNLAVGEMATSQGKMTSAPAVMMVPLYFQTVTYLLVRGYDNTLWYCAYSDGVCGSWGSLPGNLLSAPAVTLNQSPYGFYVYAILSDNQIYRRLLQVDIDNGSGNITDFGAWEAVDVPGYWPTLDLTPTPTLDAPAVVARGSQVDLFRLGANNTLRWRHFDGSAWTGWQSLGGILASAPEAVTLPNGGMQVFAAGPDNTLWTRKYNTSWGDWQEIGLTGMAQGVTITSAPTAAVANNGAMDVFVRGSDGQLWSGHSANGSAWDAWVAGGGNLASQVAIPGSDFSSIFALTKAGGIQVKSGGGAWANIPGSLPECCTRFYTGLNGVQRLVPLDNNQNYSLDVETGYFWGDGRKQIVVAYAPDTAHVKIALFDTSVQPAKSGFMPEKVAEVQLNHAASFFRIATGDFVDKDGVDDIAVAYVTGSNVDPANPDGINQYAVDIIKFDRTNRSLQVVVSGALAAAKDPSNNAASSFVGTLDIAAGDFDGDHSDEVAVITGWKNDSYLYLDVRCKTWNYFFITSIFNADFTSGNYALSLMTTEEKKALEAAAVGTMNSVGLTLAAGDLNGDGRDELVRTWPNDLGNWEAYTVWLGTVNCSPAYFNYNFTRNLQALAYDGSNWSTTKLQTTEQGQYSYADRLAVGDFNSDLKDEILFQKAMGDKNVANPTAQYLLSWRYDNTNGYTYTGYFDSLGWYKYPRLVAGDFTGEGVHVGKPTYREQNRVDTLVAVVNAPPKHLDLIKGSDGALVKIKTPEDTCSSSADPACTDSKFASDKGVTSSEQLSTKRAVTISGGLETQACAGGGVENVAEAKACAAASINATYGMNFEKTKTDIASVKYSSSTFAATDDKIVYFGSAYQIWEYPILNGNTSEAPAYITVAFPKAASTGLPNSASGYSEPGCNENWYSADHQPGNIWSYDPIGDITFADFGPVSDPNIDKLPNLVSTNIDDNVIGEVTFAKSTNKQTSSTVSHGVEASSSLSVEAKGKTGGVDLEGSVKATVKGDYQGEELETDTITTDTNSTFSVNMGHQPDNLKYKTRVMLYWAMGGYQVLNFQAGIGGTAGWTNYNKPDPAFLLPWYGFPDTDSASADYKAPPCGADKQLWSPSITITRKGDAAARITSASAGDQVTIWARLRNYSNVDPKKKVTVTFYLGAPSLNVKIGEATVNDTSSNLLNRNNPRTVSYNWTVSGSGDQKIYAVIDQGNLEDEMHDEDDLINNNTGYTSLSIGAAGFNDSNNDPHKPFQGVAYSQGAGSLGISFSQAGANLAAVTRFNLKDAPASGAGAQSAAGESGMEMAASAAGTQSAVIGNPFELAAYQGDSDNMWNKPRSEFALSQGAGSTPAAIAIDYNGMSLSDSQAKKLILYRQTSIGLEPATLSCSPDGKDNTLYQQYLFLSSKRLVVPICKTGTFVLLLPPAITSLDPASVLAGGPAFTLTVNGVGFDSGAVVRWNGADRPTTFISATELTAAISAADIAAFGSSTVTVFNPGADGGLSNGVVLKITTKSGKRPLFLPFIRK